MTFVESRVSSPETTFVESKGVSLSNSSKDKNKKGGSKEKGTTMVIDAPMMNDDGDSENPWKMCPNSASDGVVIILTPSLEKDTVVVYSRAAMKVESPLVVDETVEKEKLSPVVNTSD
ncbi:hypothetical protein Tco_0767067 [Tanacetum coccineum]